MVGRGIRGACLVVGIALLAGCGGGSSSGAKTTAPPDTSSTSSGPPTPRRYSTVVELRDAAKDAGTTCPDWKQTDVVKFAAQSGSCSDDSVFATYATTAQLDEAVATYKEINTSADAPMLVGANWSIVAPAKIVNYLKDEMGGTVVSAQASG